MLVRILVASKYSNPKTRGRTTLDLNKGDEVRFPDFYAKSLIDSNLVEAVNPEDLPEPEPEQEPEAPEEPLDELDPELEKLDTEPEKVDVKVDEVGSLDDLANKVKKATTRRKAPAKKEE
jgi:hypothetical protein